MLQTIIKFILSRLAGISSAQWQQIIGWVIDAEHTIVGGGFKRDSVYALAKAAWPSVAQWILDALIGLAVGYAGKQGWIRLGDSK